MRFPTPADVVDMQQRGFDASTLQEQEARCLAAEAVRNAVFEAFAHVSLGSGVGLYEGQALDAYADDATRKSARGRDELLNWRAIPHERLRECNSSLSFLDAEGMRFHLPAFVLAELQGEFGYDLVYHLCHVAEYERQFDLLTEPQRAAIGAFLALVRGEPECALEQEHIDRSLASFWRTKAEA